MAGDYATALMLMGMGDDALSVVPTLLAEVKFAVRESTLAEAKEIARLALAETCSEGVRRVLTQARDRLHLKQIENRGDAELTLGADGNGDSKKRESN
jgi:signal transduction protein with GAF and PtsI domain